MRFGERMVVYIFRPIYRTFFERLLWWFLAKLKIFLLGEIGVQISECLVKIDNVERRLREIEELAAPLRDAELKNAAQWDAMEQLLLAMFRQPELLALDSDRELGMPPHTATSSAGELNRAHAASNIR